MAHFALINSDNIVFQVLVVDNSKLLVEGVETESKGIEWLLEDFNILSLYPQCAEIKQTSYNGSFRNKFAGIGDTYNATLNAFISPQPYPSWQLVGANWQAPVSMPNDGKPYYWDEDTLSWIEITI